MSIEMPPIHITTAIAECRATPIGTALHPQHLEQGLAPRPTEAKGEGQHPTEMQQSKTVVKAFISCWKQAIDFFKCQSFH
jgi:hypothetical protein